MGCGHNLAWYNRACRDRFWPSPPFPADYPRTTSCSECSTEPLIGRARGILPQSHMAQAAAIPSQRMPRRAGAGAEALTTDASGASPVRRRCYYNAKKRPPPDASDGGHPSAEAFRGDSLLGSFLFWNSLTSQPHAWHPTMPIARPLPSAGRDWFLLHPQAAVLVGVSVPADRVLIIPQAP